MEFEIFFEDNKKVNARYKDRIIKTDQPVEDGGDNSAPAPFDLFLASIGTCTGIYVKSFCDSRNIPSDKIKIVQSTHYNKELRLIDKISINIKLPSDFPEKYKTALLNSANLCTVKKHLQNPPEVEVTAMLENLNS